jgi:signal peptidase II
MKTGSARSERRRWLKWVILFVTIVIAITLDLVTKYYVERHLAIGEVNHVLPFLDLQRTSNQGVAFGLLGGRLALILPANLVALAVVFVYVLIERRPWLAGIAGGIIMGGSLGNLVQRLAYGRVTDFLKFPHWPNYNMADFFILVGISAVFIGVLVEGLRPNGAFRSGPSQAGGSGASPNRGRAADREGGQGEHSAVPGPHGREEGGAPAGRGEDPDGGRPGRKDAPPAHSASL